LKIMKQRGGVSVRYLTVKKQVRRFRWFLPYIRKKMRAFFEHFLIVEGGTEGILLRFWIIKKRKVGVFGIPFFYERGTPSGS